MHNTKKNFWLDMLFILIGVVTLLLLFMPVEYIEYRYAGYVGVGVFLAFLVWRERRRKKKGDSEQKTQENEETQNDKR